MDPEIGFESLDDFDGMGSDFEDFDLEEEDGFGELFDAEDGFAGEEFDALDDFDSIDALDGFSELEGEGIDAETASLMMDMYADIAAEAENDTQADAFLPLIASLAPMAIKALAPVAVRAAKRVLPNVAKGVVGIGRRLLRSPSGRKALRALPSIARGVARDQLKRVARGQRVTGRTVARSAARQTLPFLRDPRIRRLVMRRCRHRARIAKRRFAVPASRRLARFA